MTTFREKKEEFSSDILAGVYLACKGIVALTIGGVYGLLGIPKEKRTLRHAEIYLVSTTLIFIALIGLAQFWMPLGWLIVVLGNIRILQIISLNLLTLMFDFTPTSGGDAALKRARWHFVALSFSMFDAFLAFAFMFQFFDKKFHIMNQPLAHFIDYFYYVMVTMMTVGYGDITPVTPFGRFLACYAMSVSLFMIVFFVNGVAGRLQKHI